MANGDDTVRVVAPDGTTGTIPRANLQKAVARGYKPAEPPPWYSRVGHGFKEYVIDPAVNIGKESYERGQRTSPGSGIGGAAFELPGTILDALTGSESEQLGRSAQAMKEFESKPGIGTGARAFSEAAYSLPGVGPIARDLVTTEDPFEMIGKAAGIITGEKLPGLTRGAVRGTERAVRGTAREVLLPGESEVTEARAAHESAQAKELAAHEERAARIEQDNKQDLALARSEHEKELANLAEEHEKRIREVGAKNSADEAAYNTKVEQAKDSYSRKLAEAEKKRVEASAKSSGAEVKRRTTGLVRSGPVYQRLSGMADKVAEGVTNLDKSVREAYNARWGAWRMSMGDAIGNLEPVQQAVVDAESNILKGSPENIAIFRSILKEGEDPILSQASVFKGGSSGVDVKEILGSMKSEGERNRFLRSLKDEGVTLPGEEPKVKAGSTLSIDQLQGYSTELGNKLYRGGNIAGDVRRALKSVRDAADAEVQRVAVSNGTWPVLKRLRSDWAEYMGDFYDHDGPLYKMKTSLNSDTRISLLSGGEGPRVVDSLGRYARFNKDLPASVGSVRSLVKQIRELPGTEGKALGEVERPKFPERPTPRPTPERPAGPESVRISPRETPPAPQTSPFDRQAYEKQRFAKVVQRFHQFGWDDKTSIIGGLVAAATGHPPYSLTYPVLKRIVGRVLGSPRFATWLTEHRTEEIVRNTAIVTNPRADRGQKAIAQAELEYLQEQRPTPRGGNLPNVGAISRRIFP